MSITIFTLSYCDTCLWLKDKLKEESIDFKEEYCDTNKTLAKQIESKLNSDYYPMAMFKYEDEKVYFVFGGSEKITDIEEKEFIVYYQTIPQLTLLLKKLNEK